MISVLLTRRVEGLASVLTATVRKEGNNIPRLRALHGQYSADL